MNQRYVFFLRSAVLPCCSCLSLRLSFCFICPVTSTWGSGNALSEVLINVTAAHTVKGTQRDSNKYNNLAVHLFITSEHRDRLMLNAAAMILHWWYWIIIKKCWACQGVWHKEAHQISQRIVYGGCPAHSCTHNKLYFFILITFLLMVQRQ